MTIGAVILAIWQYASPADAFLTAPLVASGVIAGDGVWSMPAAILSFVKVEPPLCAQVMLSCKVPQALNAITAKLWSGGCLAFQKTADSTYLICSGLIGLPK